MFLCILDICTPDTVDGLVKPVELTNENHSTNKTLEDPRVQCPGFYVMNPWADPAQINDPTAEPSVTENLHQYQDGPLLRRPRNTALHNAPPHNTSPHNAPPHYASTRNVQPHNTHQHNNLPIHNVSTPQQKPPDDNLKNKLISVWNNMRHGMLLYETWYMPCV